MGEISITPVSDKAQREQFITFPWKVYADDPNWVPPLISERKQFLDPDHNPFFEHAQATFYLALRNGRRVGTIGAFTNHLYNQVHDANAGFFGFFEVLDDPEAAAALLATAQTQLKADGHDELIGPMQYSTNDELGLLVDGFDDPPRILMTYNPPRYQGYIEAAGFEKAMDLWAYAMDIAAVRASMSEKVKRVSMKIRQRYDLTLRTVNMQDFDNEVARIKDMYNAIWQRNWGFVPMTDGEVELLAQNLKQIIDPDFVPILERDGRAVAFGIALPDLNQPLLKAYPRPGKPEVLTLLKMLWHWKVRPSMTWVRAWALGVLPEVQGLGLESLLLLELSETAYRKGYPYGEMSWILENNTRIQQTISQFGAEVYKTYRIYKKPL